MKIALVYDRVNKWGGAERVLKVLHEIFPDAALYTSVYSSKRAKWAKIFPEIHTTFLQNFPFIIDNHEKFAWLMPMAFESLDLSEYDLVISVTSEFCKGIIVKPPAVHICYCLTPTRYLWSGHNEYFNGFINKTISYPVIKYLKKWDLLAAQRPDVVISISTEVQNRVRQYYNRDSDVIFPPVDFQTESNSQLPVADYYLLVARLVKYKKIDLAIRTFNKLNKKLIVIGEGREKDNLKLMAKENVIFKGIVSDAELSDYYLSAKSLVMPQFEDFGLVSVEAQLHGTPVIAYGKGGALDTVVDGETGILFYEQSEDALGEAIDKFEKMEFDKCIIKKNAKRFSKERFKDELFEIIKKHT